MIKDIPTDPNQEVVLKLIYNVVKNYDLNSRAYSAFFDFINSGNSSFNECLDSSWSIEYRTKKEKWVKKLVGKTTNSSQIVNNTVDNNIILLKSFLNESDIKKYIRSLEQESPYLKKDFKLSNNVKIMGKLLELSKNEMIFMQAIHAMDLYMEAFENTFYNIFALKTTFSETWAQILGFNKKEITDILNNSILVKFDFVKHHSGCNIDSDIHVFKKMFYMIPILSDILDIPDLKENNIEDVLFPGNLKTELSVDNYHQKEEIEIVGDIINSSIKNKSIGTNIMFYGLPGTGKTELSLVMAEKHGWKIKSVGDIDMKNDREKGRHERIFNLKLATKIYAKSSEKIVLLFDEMEDLFKFDINADFSKSYLNRIIETSPVPIIWTCNDLDMMERSVLRRMTMSIKFDVPPTSARQSIWEHENKKQKLGLDNETIQDLSEVYDVVPSVISTVSSIAKAGNLDSSKLGNIIENQVTLMNYGFKKKFNRSSIHDQDKLYDLSFINSDHDIVKMSEQLKKCKPNFSLCLYGPPGTGKSAYGKYIARVLGKQVLYKKASDLLGKYVGETEENITRAFKQASDDDKVLIFDEADSFLGSRASATHSWEISQVNQFLTEMENHDKPFICTTNLIKNLDAASLRRFTFRCNFTYLKREQIAAIYLKYFKQEAPKSVLDSELLTPGDFAVVKKKADIMNITDNHELAKMLLLESEGKPEFRHKLGF